ncbi:hypothetical protein N9B94_01150 [Verrucomicrobia bacterium]|nr:hypothetical protein [Verrucomicrobiota bacterium]
MSSPQTEQLKPMNLSAWPDRINKAMLAGGVITVAYLLKGYFSDDEAMLKQFSFSWLTNFMFFASLGLGGLFLTMVHHLVDANWSLPIRRINETLGSLLQVVAVFFLITCWLTPQYLFSWWDPSGAGAHTHAVVAKSPLLTKTGWYLGTFAVFAIWCFFSSKLRSWSLRQDEVGGSEPTYKMRMLSYFGMAAFALSLTLGSILWVKALEPVWFSTMYGVVYFAGSTWLTLVTVWVIMGMMHRQGVLKDVIKERQYYFCGTLFFAFTVFYSYVHFSQFFIIWNANIPEETFWYLERLRGGWYWVAMLIIFGHFFIPFLTLLRIDAKKNMAIMLPMAGWAWFVHWADMSFNVMPVLHPEGGASFLDLAVFLLMGGILYKVFMSRFFAHAAYPLRDPRIAEAMEVYVKPESETNAAKATSGGAK